MFCNTRVANDAVVVRTKCRDFFVGMLPACLPQHDSRRRRCRQAAGLRGQRPIDHVVAGSGREIVVVLGANPAEKLAAFYTVIKSLRVVATVFTGLT